MQSDTTQRDLYRDDPRRLAQQWLAALLQLQRHVTGLVESAKASA